MSASHRRGLAGDRLTSQWSDGDQIYMTAHVRFGSEADICAAKRYVRYYTESRHSWNGRADIVSLRSA